MTFSVMLVFLPSLNTPDACVPSRPWKRCTKSAPGMNRIRPGPLLKSQTTIKPTKFLFRLWAGAVAALT
jgi:hypothetical protein